MTTIHRNRIVALGVVVLLCGAAGGASLIAQADAATTAPTSVVPVEPFRILDTRVGTGTDGAVSPVGPAASIDVQVAGVGPVPLDVVGVVLNLTGTAATEPTFVTAWPTGSARPLASALNLTPGIDAPNAVIALLGTDGKISLYVNSGMAHLVADVTGYLTAVPPTTAPTTSVPEPTITTRSITHAAPSATTTLGAPTILGGGCVRLGGAVQSELRVDFNLPVGATITGISVVYATGNTNGTPLNFHLHRTRTQPNVFPNSTIIGDPLLTGSTGGTSLTTDMKLPVIPPTTPNEFYWLSILGPVHPGPDTLNFCSATVTYTVVET
jgi:hypothetical protein